MRFGTRAADAKARGGGGTSDTWIKNLKAGDTRVRFLQETDDWVEYFEHYNPGGFPFPCTGNRQKCPGCTSKNEQMSRASRRYAMNVLRDGYVEVLKVPVTLYDRLVTRSQRNGGVITDRDYTLVKSGTGLDTEYDYDQEEKSKIDLKQHKLYDIEELLREAFLDAWPDYELETEPASVGKEPPPSKPSSEKDQPEEEQSGSDREITVDELKKMRIGQIYDLLESENVNDYPEDLTKPQLIDWIVERYSA